VIGPNPPAQLGGAPTLLPNKTLERIGAGVCIRVKLMVVEGLVTGWG